MTRQVTINIWQTSSQHHYWHTPDCDEGVPEGPFGSYDQAIADARCWYPGVRLIVVRAEPRGMVYQREREMA